MTRWAGQTVAVIASGPSLTAEDCDLVERAGVPTIAVNSSWKLARCADVIYAGDLCWWEQYRHEIDIAAERWTCSRQAASRFIINHHRIAGSYNSGQRAIQFAVEQEAAQIVLLGFDCSLDNGIHWHGPHDRTKNPCKTKVKVWHRQFRLVARMAKKHGCEVVNCSRATALNCFPIRDLESVLESVNRHVAVAG